MAPSTVNHTWLAYVVCLVGLILCGILGLTDHDIPGVVEAVTISAGGAAFGLSVAGRNGP